MSPLKRRTGPSGRVRIIAGRWRGARVEVVGDTTVRPTPDRVRETLFNWLQASVAGARCLDLFAGTGVLGLEALSRGARDVCFVERDRRLADAIRKRAETLGAKVQVVCGDVADYLDAADRRSFDIVFVDPPYDLPLQGVLGKLGAVLAANALVYVERSAADGLPAVPGFEWHKRGRAGAVCFGLARVLEPSD